MTSLRNARKPAENKTRKHLDSVLKRYKKYSEQFEKESKRLCQWTKVLPVGQYPPVFDRALTKHSTFPREKLKPLWKQIRGRIVKNNKTVWQHFPLLIEDTDFPPLFREIAPLLEEVSE